MPNRCTLVTKEGDPPTPWELPARQDWMPVDCTYHGQALAEASARLGDRGLHFIVTWYPDELPEYGDRVVAVLLGDEWATVPSYLDRVLCVFKTMGVSQTRPFASPWPFKLWKAVDTVKGFRNGLRNLSRARKTAHLRPSDLNRVYDIPLGTFHQVEVPFKPMSERSVDLFFAGDLPAMPSLLRPSTLKPKTMSRGAMALALRRLAASRPELKLDCGLYAGSQRSLTGLQYSEKLMDSKVSLSPRGSHLETFRTFESARAGCAIVANPLPPFWYYEGCPAIVLEDWASLEKAVATLFDTPGELQRRHEQALAWYEGKLSPGAVGRFMAERVDALLPAP